MTRKIVKRSTFFGDRGTPTDGLVSLAGQTLSLFVSNFNFLVLLLRSFFTLWTFESHGSGELFSSSLRKRRPRRRRRCPPQWRHLTNESPKTLGKGTHRIPTLNDKTMKNIPKYVRSYLDLFEPFVALLNWANNNITDGTFEADIPNQRPDGRAQKNHAVATAYNFTCHCCYRFWLIVSHGHPCSCTWWQQKLQISCEV